MTPLVGATFGCGSRQEEGVMIFASMLAWAAKEFRIRRTRRILQGLSDEDLRDIGLSRGMIESAARHQAAVWG